MNDLYCRICDKQFNSKMSLYMHYLASKVHRKNTPEYHNKEYLKKKENKNLNNKNKKVNWMTLYDNKI